MTPPLWPHSAPTLTAADVSAVAGKATVTPPSAGRPWAQYELTVCVKNASPPSCRTLSPLCTATGDANAATECSIPGCVASTTYTVRATALLADGTRSPQSAAAEFTTAKYPAPAVLGVATSPNSAKITVTPPATGEPWAKYELEICPTANLAACILWPCSPVVASPGTTDCIVGDAKSEVLLEATEYLVRATAVKADGTTRSLPSPTDAFTTPSHG